MCILLEAFHETFSQDFFSKMIEVVQYFLTIF